MLVVIALGECLAAARRGDDGRQPAAQRPHGLLLLLFGIPVYVWQQHEHARGVAAHRVQ